jgi:hypothetical protein
MTADRCVEQVRHVCGRYAELRRLTCQVDLNQQLRCPARIRRRRIDLLKQLHAVEGMNS